MDKIRMLYLSGEELKALGAMDMQLALEDVEEALKLVHLGDVILPSKISMGFGKSIADESVKGRINAMPAYLGGRFDIAGIKWIGSNPLNAEKGLPRASAVTILNDAVGGVTVQVQDDFSTVDASIPVGIVQLKGQQALS